jgi:hypothetical protein
MILTSACVAALLATGCPPREKPPVTTEGDSGKTVQTVDKTGLKRGPIDIAAEEAGYFAPDSRKIDRESPVQFEPASKGLPTTGNWKSDPVLADINGDGFLDIAALSRMGEGPRVWLGDGGRSWRESSKGLRYGEECCGGGVAFGDINHDGHIDLAIGDHCHGGWIYFGDGKGNWELAAREIYPVEISHGDEATYKGAEDIDMADFNADGHLDIIMPASDDGGINIFLGDGRGTNEGWHWHDSALPKTSFAKRASFVDINGDGFLDVLASAEHGPRVWLGDGRGGLTSASDGLPAPIYGGFYNGHDLGDFNGDGLLDVLAGNWADGPELYLQQPDGSWQKTKDVFPQMVGGAYGVAGGDMDGDGHLDIVCTGRLPRETGFIYGVYLLLGDGKGNFAYTGTSSGLPIEGLAFTYGISLADIDKDGRLDIVACSGGMTATPSMTITKPRSRPDIEERLIVWLNRAK